MPYRGHRYSKTRRRILEDGASRGWSLERVGKSLGGLTRERVRQLYAEYRVRRDPRAAWRIVRNRTVARAMLRYPEKAVLMRRARSLGYHAELAPRSDGYVDIEGVRTVIAHGSIWYQARNKPEHPGYLRHEHSTARAAMTALHLPNGRWLLILPYTPRKFICIRMDRLPRRDQWPTKRQIRNAAARRRRQPQRSAA